MTHDEIIKPAREARGIFHGPLIEQLSISEQDFLEKLAPALIAAGATAEREACAKVCDEKADQIIDTNRMVSAYVFAGECAAAIRARGEKGGSE